MSVEIRERETGSAREMHFVAYCDGKRCGHIEAYRTKVSGRVAYKVGDVRVVDEYRRRGVATKLYEAAAGEACRRRARLASTERLTGAHSNAFWEKQVAKGRAVKRKVRGNPEPVYVLKDCPVTSLAGARKRKR